ncbi:hypothetical protein M2138_000520 [Dysgonomonadaceae bacterium PH5-43]|nr:hypothetical protein [Dysgonomonadaceae bacterium PH5-43]
MSTQKAIAPLMTPILGMTPIIVFFLLDSFLPYPIAFCSALAAGVIYFIINVFLAKQEVPYTLQVSLVALFAFIVLGFIPIVRNYVYIENASAILGILLVISFFIFIRIQGYFRAKILTTDDISQDTKILKFNGEIYVMNGVIFTQTLYLLIILVYSLLPLSYHNVTADFIIYHLIILIFIVIHVAYELINWHIVRKEMEKEEWLPIIDETGSVHGRVALSVSRESGDKYMHPIIRIALINKGRLYLRERNNSFPISESHYIDYPFERYLRFGESLDEGVRQTFINNGADADLPYRFVFRYVDKTIETNRLVYLYACTINDDKLLSKLQIQRGKWWTEKQINDSIGMDFFSPSFEKEYEFLDATILTAERLMGIINDE